MGKTPQIFDGLNSSEVQKVLAHGILKEYEKGDVLFKKGSHSSAMYACSISSRMLCSRIAFNAGSSQSSARCRYQSVASSSSISDAIA